MKIIGKIISGLLIVGVLIYAGACAYSNLSNKGPSIPDSTKAPWVFTLRYTGQQILSTDYKIQGNIYILNNYWEEVKGGSYRYKKATIKLDPSIFGPIGLSRRPVSGSNE
jgi:hypothetical protein